MKKTMFLIVLVFLYNAEMEASIIIDETDVAAKLSSGIETYYVRQSVYPETLEELFLAHEKWFGNKHNLKGSYEMYIKLGFTVIYDAKNGTLTVANVRNDKKCIVNIKTKEYKVYEGNKLKRTFWIHGCVPWGVWNPTPVDENDIQRDFSFGSYYEVEESGLLIVPVCHSYLGQRGPSMYAKAPLLGSPTPEWAYIEKSPTSEDGYILTIRGRGYKTDSKTEAIIFAENITRTVKMVFIDNNTCIFEYIPASSEADYTLLCFKENVPYYRLEASK